MKNFEKLLFRSYCHGISYCICLLIVLLSLQINLLNAALSSQRGDSFDEKLFTMRESIDYLVKDNNYNLGLEIHFEKSNFEIAKRVSDIIKTDAPRLFQYFEYVPASPLHIIVSNDQNYANGYALVFPNNTISLNIIPPYGPDLLSSNENWIRAVVLHELTHVIQADQTSGLFKYLRKVFGNIVKPGMVVPLWFLEGVAVWAESNFTEGGRLNSSLMRSEFFQTLLEDNICASTSCVDNPGLYPYMHYPYWAGSNFMTYLETKKKGTIKDLIKDNSYNFPFFLNWSFETVTDKRSDKNYKDFIKATKDEISVKQKKVLVGGELEKMPKIELSRHLLKDEHIGWHKGSGIVGDNFVFVIDKKEINDIVALSLSNHKNNENVDNRYSVRTNGYLDFIFFDGSKKSQDEKTVAINSFKIKNQEMKFENYFFHLNDKNDESGKNGKNHLQRIKNQSPEINDYVGKYILKTQFKRLDFYYKDMAWHLDALQYPNQVDQADQQNDNYKLKNILSFNKFVDVNAVEVFDDLEDGSFSLMLKIREDNGSPSRSTYSVVKLVFVYKKDIDSIVLSKSTYLYSSNKQFEYLGNNGESFFYKHNDGVIIINPKTNNSINASFNNKYFSSETNRIVFWKSLVRIYFDYEKKQTLYLFDVFNNELYVDKQQKILKEIVSNTDENYLPVKEHNLPLQTAETIAAQGDFACSNCNAVISSYPSLRHFLPAYWMVGYVNNPSYNIYSVQTLLTDPKMINSLALNLNYYSNEVNKYTADGVYSYNKINWTLFTAYQNLYRWSDSLNRRKFFEMVAFGGTYVFDFADYYFFGAPIVSKVKEEELFSPIENEKMISSVTIGGGVKSVWPDDFLQNLKFTAGGYHYDVLDKESYNASELTGKIELAPFKSVFDFKMHVSSQYGKMYKKGIRSGVFYLGGTKNISSDTSSAVSPAAIYGNAGASKKFYGIDAGDAFGKEFLLNSLEGDYKAWDLYSGFRLFPFYLKTLTVLGGMEQLKTDYVYINKRLYRDEDVISRYWGVQLATTIAYHVPVNFSLINVQYIKPVNYSCGFFLAIESSF